MVYSLRDVVCLSINEFLYPSNTVVKMQTVSTLDFEQYIYHIGSWISIYNVYETALKDWVADICHDTKTAISYGWWLLFQYFEIQFKYS